MDVRYAPDPKHFTSMDTAQIRENFLIADLFVPDQTRLVYSHTDRSIVGSAVPLDRPLPLDVQQELAAAYFAQRRELGVINVGGRGSISVDDDRYPMARKDALYIGRGSQKIAFASDDPAAPAKFYFVSLPAHTPCPARHITIEDAERVEVGSEEHANRRTIYKYIHPNGVQSCQLVMGFTELAPGSIWNTMPAHTHARRSEVYMYFDLAGDSVVFHFMGQVHETRHIVVRNGQAVLSPSWSIHSGAGTASYSFVWAMGGENQDFDDMDWIRMEQLA